MQLSGSVAQKFATAIHTIYLCVYTSIYMCTGSNIFYRCTLTESKPVFCKTTDNSCFAFLSKSPGFGWDRVNFPPRTCCVLDLVWEQCC